MATGLSASAFPFLTALSAEGRRALETLAPARARPHRTLLRRGDATSGAYLIVGGALRVYYISPAGREATLYTVAPGQTCVLALTAGLRAEPYPAWVEAGPEGGEYVVVPVPLVRRLLEGERAFRDFMFEALSGRVFELMRSLEELGSDPMEQRLARYLLQRQGADASVRMSQARIAAELGSAREVVFRSLRVLAARRLVSTGRLCVRILDHEGLRLLADGRGGARPSPPRT